MIVWVVLLAIALPLLPRVDNATTAASNALPSSDASQLEASRAAALFPNSSVQADTLLVLGMSNATSPLARDATISITHALQTDPSLDGLMEVDSLYTSYADYLDGQAQLALGVLAPGTEGSTSALAGVNGTAQLLWGPAATYLAVWQSLVTANPTSPPSAQNWPAFQDVNTSYASNGAAFLDNLSLFYRGDPGQDNGFNGTADCAAAATQVQACAQGVVRLVEAPASTGPLGPLVLSTLGLSNFTQTSALHNTTARFLALSSGLPASLLSYVWEAFPSAAAAPATITAWSQSVAGNGTVETYPVPVPTAMLSEYVDPGNNVTVLIVALNEADDSSGAATVVGEIDRLTPLSLTQTAPGGGISWVQTGDAALTVGEGNLINSDTDTILPITILLLLLIASLYFRAPLTPIVVMVTVGVALLLGLAGMVITTYFTGPVSQTSLTLLVTFILGVGTDYSVFLTARYREELWQGKAHREALVTAVTWAGESIATSGTTVVLATLAMTFSGTQMIANWGQVLSVGVAVAVVVALTLVPAVLMLIGPRLFWPYTGARFRRQAERRAKAYTEGSTYFQRASHFSTRRPALVLLVAALVSLPLVYIALTAPLSYSYFGQLPSDQSTSQGLQELAGNFGPGYVFPMDVLVTFQDRLVGPNNASNAQEFAEAAEIAQALSAASGVRSVGSLVGPGGAPLSDWVALASTPPALRAELLATLAGYVGIDGRTVSYTVSLNANGNSNPAVATLNGVEANLSSYQAGHPAVLALYYGGAPSITKDLQSQLAVSSLVMESVIVIGLLLILFIALGSAVLPPLAVITIGLSAAWAWALTYAVFVLGLGLSLFFYIPPVLFLLIMGLGMDYNVFILTRIREERLKGKAPKVAVVDAVAHTAGIITAAAAILGGAFFALTAAHVALLRVLGFAVGAAVLLDALVVRTYLVPAMLGAGGDRIWWRPKWLPWSRSSPADVPVVVKSDAVAERAPASATASSKEEAPEAGATAPERPADPTGPPEAKDGPR